MSMTPPEADIAGVKVASTDPTRKGKYDLIITYKVPNSSISGTFKLQFEGQTQQTISTAVAKHYKETKSIIPTKVKL